MISSDAVHELQSMVERSSNHSNVEEARAGGARVPCATAAPSRLRRRHDPDGIKQQLWTQRGTRHQLGAVLEQPADRQRRALHVRTQRTYESLCGPARTWG